MHNFNLFPDYDVSQDREVGENGRKGGFAVYDKEWDMVDFEPICQVPHSGTTGICMRYNDYFVSPIY